MKHQIDIASNNSIYIDGKRVVGRKPYGYFETRLIQITDSDLVAIANRCEELMRGQTMSNERLIGKIIVKADVDGFGIELTFDDGSVFVYDASDGGYSTYGFEGADDETTT